MAATVIEEFIKKLKWRKTMADKSINLSLYTPLPVIKFMNSAIARKCKFGPKSQTTLVECPWVVTSYNAYK